MRIWRYRLLIAVSCLYFVSAFMLLTSIRKLAIMEEEEVVVYFHPPKERQLTRRQTSYHPLSAGSLMEREIAENVTFEESRNSTMMVKADPFFDNSSFYCSHEQIARGEEDHRAVDFIRAGNFELYYLNKAYLDMRPGYRSPSIRVLIAMHHSMNASDIRSSIHLCKTARSNDQKSDQPKHKKVWLNVQSHSKVELSPFVYEFNENHNKPVGGYIISFQLVTTRIRLTAFPASLTLIYAGYVQTQVTIPIRKMIPATFRPELTDEFKQPDSDGNVPKKEYIQFNAPVDEDGKNALLNSEWNKRYAHSYSHDFTVCVPPLYGTIHLHRLIEFIEVHRLLGVSRFMFYIYNVGNINEVQRLLGWYKEKFGNSSKGRDAMEIWRWTLPVEDNEIWYKGQLLAIHHCLYESVGKSHYVSFNDIDEVIVPRNGLTWQELFKRLDVIYQGRIAKPAGFRFRGVFFDIKKLTLPNEDLYMAKLLGLTTAATTTTTKTKQISAGIHLAPEFKIELENPTRREVLNFSRRFMDELQLASVSRHIREAVPDFNELHFMRFVERNDPPTRVRTKCIVKPDFVFEMGIHHISKQHVEEMEPREVEAEMALLQHYRICEAAFDVTCGKFIPDFTLVSKYKRQLYLNLLETLSALNLSSIRNATLP